MLLGRLCLFSGVMTQKTVKTGRELEQHVAQAYCDMGARKVEQGSHLAGNQIDIYIEMETPHRRVVRVAIEVKDWSRRVGVGVVNKFAIIVNLLRDTRLIDEGVILSVRGFTKQARDAARTYCILPLELSGLEEMVAQVKAGVPSYTVPPFSSYSTRVSGHEQILDLLWLNETEEFNHKRLALGLPEHQVSSALGQVAREGDDYRLRRSAVRKLGQGRYYPIDYSVGVIEEVLLKDQEEPCVRSEAIEALGNLGSVKGLPVLVKELKRLDESEYASGHYGGDTDFAEEIIETYVGYAPWGIMSGKLTCTGGTTYVRDYGGRTTGTQDPRGQLSIRAPERVQPFAPRSAGGGQHGV